MASYYVNFDSGSDAGGVAGSAVDPWKTLAHSVSHMSTGDTLYVVPGTTLPGDQIAIDAATWNHRIITFRSSVVGTLWNWKVAGAYGPIYVDYDTGNFGELIVHEAEMTTSHGTGWVVTWATPQAPLTTEPRLRFVDCKLTSAGTYASSSVFLLGVPGAGVPGHEGDGYVHATSKGRVLEVVDCEIITSKKSRLIRNESAKSILFDGCYGSYTTDGSTWETSTGSGIVFVDITLNAVPGTCGSFSFINSPGFAFSGTLPSTSWIFAARQSVGSFTVQDNVFSGIVGAGLVGIDPQLTVVTPNANTVTIKDNDWGTVTLDALAPGWCFHIIHSWLMSTDYSIGVVTIDGNTMIVQGVTSVASTIFMLGRELGVNAALTVINNRIYGDANTSLGIYLCGCTNADVHHNVVVTQASPLARVATILGDFHHNTLISLGETSSTSGALAFRDENDGDTDFFADGYAGDFHHNICVSYAGSQVLAYMSHSSPGEMDLTNYVQEYNLYWSTNLVAKNLWTSNALGEMGPEFAHGHDLSSLISYWATIGVPTNDANSRLGDPLFVNSTNRDYRSASLDALCMDGGEIVETIGALPVQAALIASKSAAQDGSATSSINHPAKILSESPAQSAEEYSAIQHPAAIRSTSEPQADDVVVVVQHPADILSESPVQAAEVFVTGTQHTAEISSQGPAQQVAALLGQMAIVRSKGPAQQGAAFVTGTQHPARILSRNTVQASAIYGLDNLILTPNHWGYIVGLPGIPDYFWLDLTSADCLAALSADETVDVRIIAEFDLGPARIQQAVAASLATSSWVQTSLGDCLLRCIRSSVPLEEDTWENIWSSASDGSDLFTIPSGTLEGEHIWDLDPSASELALAVSSGGLLRLSGHVHMPSALLVLRREMGFVLTLALLGSVVVQHPAEVRSAGTSQAGAAFSAVRHPASILSASGHQASEAEVSVQHPADIRSTSEAQSSDVVSVIRHPAAILSESPAQTSEASAAIEHAALVSSESPVQASEAASAIEHSAKVSSRGTAQASEAYGAVQHPAAVRSSTPPQASGVNVSVQHPAQIISQSAPQSARTLAGQMAMIQSKGTAQSGQVVSVIQHPAQVLSRGPAQRGQVFGAIQHPAAILSRSGAQASRIFSGLAPVQTLPATDIQSRQFKANWESAFSATGYLLTVAADAAFTQIVPGYDRLDVGNVLTWDVVGLAPDVIYYYRVSSYSETLWGEPSDTRGTSELVIPCDVIDDVVQMDWASTADWEVFERGDMTGPGIIDNVIPASPVETGIDFVLPPLGDMVNRFVGATLQYTLGGVGSGTGWIISRLTSGIREVSIGLESAADLCASISLYVKPLSEPSVGVVAGTSGVVVLDFTDLVLFRWSEFSAILEYGGRIRFAVVADGAGISSTILRPADGLNPISLTLIFTSRTKTDDTTGRPSTLRPSFHRPAFPVWE
jgi:hypothetical protein